MTRSVGLRRRQGAALFLAALVAVAGGFTPDGAGAQTVTDLAARCVAGGGGADPCTEAAVAARSLHGHVGLLSGLGSEVAGSASTLGRRLGATPRISGSVRGVFADVGLPDLSDPGAGPAREAGFLVTGVHAGVTLGLLDGFSLLPTVGGIFSLDVVGQTSLLFLPTGEGFEGNVGGLSIGARVGILRESFTLPGVSVSVARRSLGVVRLGDLAQDDRFSVEIDPTVTSIRATVGKDILAVGVLAGVGWDSYGGTTTVRTTGEGGTALSASVTDLDASRLLYFGGASMNFLVLQLSAELGWSQGFDPVATYEGTPFDATGGTAFVSLAFRLTI